MEKKQIWVEESKLDEYLREGWIHVFGVDGTPVQKTGNDGSESILRYLLERNNMKKEKIYSKKDRLSSNKSILRCFYDKYIYQLSQAERYAKVCKILTSMAKENPNHLLDIWDKIRSKGVLDCDDISEDLFNSLDYNDCIMVYKDFYHIVSVDDSEIHFERD